MKESKTKLRSSEVSEFYDNESGVCVCVSTKIIYSNVSSPIFYRVDSILLLQREINSLQTGRQAGNYIISVSHYRL